VGRGEAGVLLGTPPGVGAHAVQFGESMAPIPRWLFQPVDEHDFAHPAEQDLARILSYYRIRWIYEPTTFHLEFREDGRPAEQITPDFYLPDHDLYIELTTMRQRLVTRKNRKVRRLRETFPSVHIKLLYRKDYDRLIGAYPAPDRILDPVLDSALLDAATIQARIAALADEIHASTSGLREFASSERREVPSDQLLHLIGVGAGSGQFLADLGRALDRRHCRVSSDELVLSRYSGGHDDERVRIGRTSKQPVAGRDIVLVADIVSSGLSLVYVTEWLRTNGARSVRICTLLDREDARIIDIPLDFVGFKAPDEVLVGYGLASYPQFRDLPHVACIHDGAEA